MRLAWFVVAALAACGPKVDPAEPFDRDDPRARLDAPVDAAPATLPTATAPIAVPPPGLRAIELERATVDAILDAGPAEFLRGLEVAAVRPDGVFAGWRLVRLVGTGRRLAQVDLKAGDLLLGINGHRLESPPDLAALWTELRTATAIEVAIDRAGEQFAIRAEITRSAPPPGPIAPPADR